MPALVAGIRVVFTAGATAPAGRGGGEGVDGRDKVMTNR